jgi:ferredoxin/flavodoxin---NADP+ reductase
MFRIVEAEFLAADIKRFVIEAPWVARKRQAGQFVIVRVHARGERIPLTIADGDPERGTITLIVQGIGKTTKLMNLLGPGDALLDLVGPLGEPSDVKKYGTVVVIGGGVGAAIAYPTAKAMREAGNHVISILGGRSKDFVILEPEIRAISDEVFISTDDGSYGRKGLVIDPLKELIAAGRPVDHVLAIGPPRMMQAVAEVTRPHRIPTIVSLNSLMVDGTGMCGGCRIITTEGARFACVDGPEFDAHTVDFNILIQRNRMYGDQEAEALQEFRESPEESVQEFREACRLEAAHPEVQSSEELVAQMYGDQEAEALQEFRESPEECVQEFREECRLEAAHPEVQSSEELVS